MQTFFYHTLDSRVFYSCETARDDDIIRSTTIILGTNDIIRAINLQNALYNLINRIRHFLPISRQSAQDIKRLI